MSTVVSSGASFISAMVVSWSDGGNFPNGVHTHWYRMVANTDESDTLHGGLFGLA